MDSTLDTGRNKRLTVAWMLVALSVTLFLTSSGLWIYSTYFQGSASPPTPKVLHKPGVSPTRTPVASETAGLYLQKFLQHDYTGMWSLLHPQVQTTWPDQNTYAQYWQKRFQGYTIAGYTLGQESTLSSWVNPETMQEYKDVSMVPVTLQIKPTAETQQEAQKLNTVDPDILHPETLYSSIPMYLSRIDATHWQVLNGGPVDLEAPILPPLHPISHDVKVPIMMYHHISDAPTQTILEKSLTVPTKMLSAHLAYLKSRKAHSITFNQLFDALYYNGPLPSNPVILTFDDGYDDAYTNAYQLLRQNGFSGMFYIITGKVGWKGQASWNQLQEMLLGGMQIGSHTINHVDIGNTYLASHAQAQKELQDSRASLQQHLHIPIQQFCYPSGEPFRHGSLALRAAIVTLLISLGYVGSTTDPGETGIFQNSLTPQVLLRIRVDGRSDLGTFQASIPW